MNKPHLEFHRLDMDQGWSTPEAIRPASSRRSWRAISMRGARWEAARGCCGSSRASTRLHLSSTITGEEVYLLWGDLTVGNDAKGQGGESFQAPTYACRPPGVHHGPFKSEAWLHAVRNPLL